MHFSAFGWRMTRKKKRKKLSPLSSQPRLHRIHALTREKKTQDLPQWDGCIAGSVAQQQKPFPKVQSKVKSSRLSVDEFSHKSVNDRSHFFASSTINIFAAALWSDHEPKISRFTVINELHPLRLRSRNTSLPGFAWAPRPWPACQIWAM